MVEAGRSPRRTNASLDAAAPDAMAADVPPPETEAQRRRALLAILPAPAEHVAAALDAVDDVWWAAAAAIAAVRAAGDAWYAVDAVHVLARAAERTAALDADVLAALDDAKRQRTPAQPATALVRAWIEADATRLPRILLRRKLWHMQWLLCIPMATSKTERVTGDVASLADTPLLTHAQRLSLAGNARALRALVGAHATVARSLFPHRFALLHTLLTSGGVSAPRLADLRLLPGTNLPVEDRESGAWVDALAAPARASPAAGALWAEHPMLVGALAELGAAPAPLPAPPPPAALSDWYRDVVHELEASLGLVDEALALARAGVALGLRPLRAAVHELEFLDLLVYRLAPGTWSRSALHAAPAASVVAAIARQPLPPAECAALLHECVLPFLARGTYADAHVLRGADESTLGVHVALMVLAVLPPPAALALVAEMLRRPWLGDARTRLAVAVLASGADADVPSYAGRCAVADAVAAAQQDGRADGSGAAATHGEAAALVSDEGPAALWTRLAPAPQRTLDAALVELVQCTRLGAALAACGAAHPPTFYAGADAAQLDGVCAALVDDALRTRDARRAVLALFAQLAPLLDAAVLPPSCARAALRTVLMHGHPALFRDVVRVLPAACPVLAAHVTPAETTALLLDAVRTWVDEAPTCDVRHGALVRARGALEAAPADVAADERALLSLCAQLSEFDVPGSNGGVLTPREVRATHKLALLARLLAARSDAYRAPHLSALITALVAAEALPPGAGEARAAALVADAAGAAGDLRAAREQVERAARAVRPLARDAAPEAWDAAWRASFQLAKHPGWTDARARAHIFAHALVLAPADHVPSVLAAWASLAPDAAVPGVPRRERASLARLLTSSLAREPSASPRRAAAGAASVAPPHAAEHAARVARSLWDVGATWWGARE